MGRWRRLGSPPIITAASHHLVNTGRRRRRATSICLATTGYRPSIRSTITGRSRMDSPSISPPTSHHPHPYSMGRRRRLGSPPIITDTASRSTRTAATVGECHLSAPRAHTPGVHRLGNRRAPTTSPVSYGNRRNRGGRVNLHRLRHDGRSRRHGIRRLRRHGCRHLHRHVRRPQRQTPPLGRRHQQRLAQRRTMPLLQLM